MTATGPIGIGLIGLNYGASRIPLIQQTPETRLVAVAARTASTARQVGEKYGAAWYTDYHDLLRRDDVEAVGLYTPSGQHLEIAREAAAAGKHLLTTKPIEITLARVDALLEACRRAGVRVATEYVFRYRPTHYTLYQRLQEGLFGKPILGEFSYKCYRTQGYYESGGGWRGTWAVDGGGALMNQGIHSVDQMLWLMGPAETITARTGTYTHRIETEDLAAALVTFRSGAVGLLVATTTFQNNRPTNQYGSDVRRIEVHGEAGSASIVEEEFVLWKAPGETDQPPLAAPPAQHAFQDLARWIRDETYRSPSLAGPDESRQGIELVLAAYESARTGQTVSLPLKENA